jgi:lysophospholipid acyltransferase (LPLAT)-like uncharacterized protein
VADEDKAGGLPPPRFVIDAPWFRNFVGARVLGGFVRLVVRTARVEYFPPSYLDDCAKLEPAIYISWHANVLATPFLAPDMTRLVTMSAPHPDGRMGAALAESFGLTTIKATGASFKQVSETGGVAGFRAMLRTLKSGKSIFLNAEVPPTPGRQVARGVVTLARLSGCPIIPVAAASNKRTIIEKLWDQMQINHPFSRVVVVGAPVMRIRPGDDEEAALARLKTDLDEAYAAALRLSRRP